MDMSQFVSVLTLTLSIVSLWRSIWAEVCYLMSKSTTETVSGLITVLRTLSLLLSTITPKSIIQDATEADGAKLLASPVARSLNVALLRLKGIPSPSAVENATLTERSRCRAEGIVVARKPLSESTVAANVLRHGTGGINVDGCRVSVVGLHSVTQGRGKHGTDGWGMGRSQYNVPQGRWPANVCLDEEAARMLDEQSGRLTSGIGAVKVKSGAGYSPRAYGTENRPIGTPNVEYGDSGGASRFFYCAKASPAERGEANNHPTVKPLALMRWLCRLVGPPNGTILDPFAGSGTTLLAATQEGFSVVGIEQNHDYCKIIRKRMAEAELPLFKGCD
jgi:hypothetical protein